jgi:aminoglycoside phosphotransferase (APT) family kinase protein
VSTPADGPRLPAPDVARPWVPEVEVTPGLAVALINSQFPQLAPVLLEPFGSGWDNTAYLVNGEWVFRFPRRAIAVPLIETEVRVLPALASRLPLPIPDPVWVGHPDDRYRWPFVGYRRIHGRIVSEAALDDDARERLARPLGEFLRSLHEVDIEEARGWGAAPDTLGRLDRDRLQALIRPRVAELVRLGVIAEAPPWLAVLEAGLAALDEEPPPVLLHGDFYARHVLVDEQARAAGVIDFGDLHIGHPGLDLSIAWSMLPPRVRPTFLGAYGGASDAVQAVARLRALTSAIFQEAYGRDVGDRATEKEGRDSLARLVAV